MPNVLSFTEIPDGRAGSEDDFGRRQLTRIFRVQFDSINVGYSYVLYAQGMPARFAAYEGPLEADAGCRAVRRSAVQDTNDYFWWTVTVEYDSISQNPALTQSGGGQGGSPTNEVPTLDPPEVRWNATHDSRPLHQSIDDPPKGIHTSAYEPFDPVPLVDVSCPQLIYTRNEAEYEPGFFVPYWNTVNNALFAGFYAKQVKLNYTTGVKEYRNNLQYWRVTYNFQVKLPDWDFHIADRGTMTLNSKGEPQKHTRAGIPTSKIFLDGGGHEFAPHEVQANGPIMLDFRAYPTSDFDELGLTGL